PLALKCWGRGMRDSPSPKAVITRCAGCSPLPAITSRRCGAFRSVAWFWVSWRRVSGAPCRRKKWPRSSPPPPSGRNPLAGDALANPGFQQTNVGSSKIRNPVQRASPASGLLQHVHRGGNRRAEPLVPLVAAARAAHRELAADRGAVVVDGAAGGVGIDGGAPAVLA